MKCEINSDGGDRSVIKSVVRVCGRVSALLSNYCGEDRSRVTVSEEYVGEVVWKVERSGST